jgi:two-component system alkaline phosphatase synthesis response regulator PhoP
MPQEIKTVLLVDDEEDILELLSYNFRKSGFRVLLAKNGLEGYRVAFAAVPDVIVTDLWMPEMDGILMCKHIRDQSQLDASRIIVLSADSDEFKAISALRAGADEYLTKPVSPSIIVNLAKKIISLGQPESPFH